MDIVGALFGWPSLLLAFGLASIGISLKRPSVIWIAVCLTTPMTFYLLGSPKLRLLALIPVIALIISAMNCRNASRWFSVSGLTVYGLYLAALGYLVSTP